MPTFGVFWVFWCATTSYVSDYSTDFDPNFWDFTKKNASAGLCRGLSCDLNCAATAATSPLVDGPMVRVDTKMGGERSH